MIQAEALTSLGYTPFEEGYRHGKRDFCVGLRSVVLITGTCPYAEGYRKGLNESAAIYREFVEAIVV